MYDFIDSEPYEAPTPMLRRVAKCAVAGLLGIILWISIVAFFACAYWLFMGMTVAHAHEARPTAAMLSVDALWAKKREEA